MTAFICNVLVPFLAGFIPPFLVSMLVNRHR